VHDGRDPPSADAVHARAFCWAVVVGVTAVVAAPASAQETGAQEASAEEAGAREASAGESESPAAGQAPTDEAAAGAPASADASATEATAAPVDGGESIDLSLQDRITAVSRKVFLKRGRFELSPFGGVSVNDAYYRRWMVGGRAAYHVVDSLSLEIGGAFNVIPEDRLPSVAEAGQDLQAVPDDAVFFGYGDVGGSFSPLYGKFAVLDDWIVHFDAFFTGGFGVTVDSNRYTVLGNELPELVPGINPAVEVGAGTRIFALRWLTVKLEARYYLWPQYRSSISTLQNLLFINLGVGFFFPFDFDYETTAARVVEG
jgi:outer membrane beta-barrel protein